jgi:hypothetical protein
MLEVLVEANEASGAARALEVTVRPTKPGHSVTEAALAAALRQLSETVRIAGDRALARAHVREALEEATAGADSRLSGSVRPDFKFEWDDGSVAVVEIKARRRSRLTDDDFAQIAEVYRLATEADASVLEAVAAARLVSRSQAGWLIQRAREEGYLPPAKGRGRQKR